MSQLIIYMAAFVGAVWTVFISLVSVPFMLLFPRSGPFWGRLWARGWCVLFGVHVTLEGRQYLETAGPVIVAPNHASMFDIFLIMGLPIDCKWIMKVELVRIPIFGWAIWAMGNYYVRRDGSGKDIDVMRRVEEGLRNGVSVVLFPEGTRTRTGELLPFRKGAFRVAQNSGAPLLPVGLVGTYGIAPKGKLPRKRGHEVTIRIGPPFPVGPSDDIGESMQRFRGVLVGLLEGRA